MRKPTTVDASSSPPLPIVQGFLTYLNDERNFSPCTARCYGVDLRQYVDFLVDRFSLRSDDRAEFAAFRPDGAAESGTATGRLLAADVELLRAYLASLAERSYSAASMARKVATLRSFHKWLERRGLIRVNPMSLIRTPKQGR